LEEKNYDAAALNGVHAVISAIDAVLVFKGGVVSASLNHEDAVKLLAEIVNEEDTVNQSRHAFAVLKMKTKIEYTDDRITENQALEIEKQTDRFLPGPKQNFQNKGLTTGFTGVCPRF